jgi:Zn-dependent protease
MDRSPFRFSGKELLQLGLATAVLSAAFAFALSCSFLIDVGLGCAQEAGIKWDTFWWPALGVSLAVVLGAFVLHELAHKFSAQFYGLWAEFRASVVGLLVALGISAGLGVVVAPPGAVVIRGPATEREAGIISLWGPIVNIVLAGIALPLWLVTDQSAAARTGLPLVGNLFQLVLFINVVLAAFNMLPVKPLDGSKIVRWSWLAFALAWLPIVGLFYVLVQGAAL